jgi:hypothetical protein
MVKQGAVFPVVLSPLERTFWCVWKSGAYHKHYFDVLKTPVLCNLLNAYVIVAVCLLFKTSKTLKMQVICLLGIYFLYFILKVQHGCQAFWMKHMVMLRDSIMCVATDRSTKKEIQLLEFRICVHTGVKHNSLCIGLFNLFGFPRAPFSTRLALCPKQKHYAYVWGKELRVCDLRLSSVTYFILLSPQITYLKCMCDAHVWYVILKAENYWNKTMHTIAEIVYFLLNILMLNLLVFWNLNQK